MDMSEVKKIDKYLDDYLKETYETAGIKTLRKKIKRIIDLKYISGFDEYSKDILALAMEKRIIIAIETDRLKKDNLSYWEKYKKNLKSANKIDLSGYIDLFIHNLYVTNEKSETLTEIKKYYNYEIYNSTKKITNKMITLPTGQKVSYGDIKDAINKLICEKIENIDIEKFETLPYKFKKAAIISGIVSAIAFTSIKNTNVEINDDIIHLTVDDAAQDKQLNNQVSSDIKRKELIQEMIEIKRQLSIERSKKDYEFIGYEDCKCPIKYQEYMYKMAKKYEIDFNVFMSIVHTETRGNFNGNGEISDYNDYGFCQINEINHEDIKNNLGITPDELLNNPYKNIEAAAFHIRNIYDLYKDKTDKDLYDNIFGTYNGWKLWKTKNTSREYVDIASDAFENIYNKSENEIIKKEKSNTIGG